MDTVMCRRCKIYHVHLEGFPQSSTLPRKMAELPPDTSLVAKHLNFSCLSCGDEVDDLSCLPCHPVSICEKKECRHNLLDYKTSCSLCKETFPRYTFAERRAVAKQRERKKLFVVENTNLPS